MFDIAWAISKPDQSAKTFKPSTPISISLLDNLADEKHIIISD